MAERPLHPGWQNRATRFLAIAVGLSAGVALVSPGAALATQISAISPTLTIRSAVPVAVNDSGVVVGNDAGARSGTNTGPFRWTVAGGFSTLTSSGGNEITHAVDVSPSGLTVGSGSTPTTPDSSRVLAWPAGSVVPSALPCAACVYVGATASAVSDAGTVLGTELVGGASADCGGLGSCVIPGEWTAAGAESTIAPNGAGVDVNNAGTVLVGDSSGYHLHSAAGNMPVPGCLARAYQLSDTGIVVGDSGGSAPVPERWSTGACANLPLLAGDTGGSAKAVSNQGVAVGSSGTHAVLWGADGSVTDLNSLLPPGSGWLLTSAIDISGDATKIVGSGTINGIASFFLLDIGGQKVSGSVFGLTCTGSSCGQVGLSGLTVLVTGTATDGSAVTQHSVSAADGSWAVSVPPGTYTAGIAPDGAKIDGTGFDPETAPNLVVASAPIAGVNFSACVVPALAAAPGSPVARLAAAPRAVLDRAGPSTTAGPCTSLYTVEMSAKIPQSRIADPSDQARYQVDGGEGYNHHPAGFPGQHSVKARKALGLATEFPGCFKTPTVEKDEKEGATAQWYSYIKGGALGSVKAAFAWDRRAQETHLVSGPSIVTARIVRVFVWRLKIHGKTQKPGTCKETSRVPILSVPVGGSDVTGKPSNSFTMIAVWPIPFLPSGINLDVDARYMQQFVEHVAGFDEAVDSLFTALGESYEAAPEKLKLGVQLATITLGTVGLVKAIGLAPGLVTKTTRAWSLAKSLLKGVHEGAEVLHYAKIAQDAPEAFAGLFGAFGEGYPLMSAVLRGNVTTRYVQNGPDKIVVDGNVIPAASTLGLSVSATQFPDISVKVSRAAAANTDPTNPSFSGVLPWTDATSPKKLYTFNPFAKRKLPAYLVSQIKGTKFDRGHDAVEAILARTRANPEIAEAIAHRGNILTDLAKEQAEVREPACDPTTGLTSSATTICWRFEDGRP